MLNEEMDEGGEKQSHVYVWQCSREKVYGLIFFKKKKKTCVSWIMKNKMDLDRQRWVWVAYVKKEVIRAWSKEYRQMPRDVKVHFLLMKC